MLGVGARRPPSRGSPTGAGPARQPVPLLGLGEGSRAARRRRKRLGPGAGPCARRGPRTRTEPRKRAPGRAKAHTSEPPHPLYLHGRRLPAPAPRDDAPRLAPPRPAPAGLTTGAAQARDLRCRGKRRRRLGAWGGGALGLSERGRDGEARPRREPALEPDPSGASHDASEREEA